MYKTIFFLFILLGMLTQCAHIEAPSGGEGDKTPPQVVDISVASNELNFDENKITIKFNKYMDRTTVIENLNISPTVKYNYSWNGKAVTVKFDSELVQNTTYSLQLGGNYSDYYKNTASEGFFVVFSTGNAIDTGKIEGKIIGKSPEGIAIFVFALDGKNADSIDFTQVTPEYKSIIGANGNFTIPALKDGKYRIFALKDKDKDGLITQNHDTLWIASADPVVKNGKSDVINFTKSMIIDKLPPEIQSITANNAKMISLNFSESIVCKNLSNDIFHLYDSASTYKINPVAVFPDLKNRKSLILAFQNDLPQKSKLFLYVDTMRIMKKNSLLPNLPQINDEAGNMFAYPKPVFLFINTDVQPALPELVQLPVKDSTKSINVDSAFTLVLSNPILFNKDIIQLKKDSITIDCQIEQIFPNQFLLRPNENLIENSWYHIDINKLMISDIWNKGMDFSVDTSQQNTLQKLYFLTENTSEYANISGVIADSTHCNAPKYITIHSEHKEYTTKISPDNSYIFSKIPAGTYKIIAFCDSNGNGKFDAGNLFPFEFSEPFYTVELELQVRSRWNINDFNFTVK